jgi:hypothetical protein
VADGRSAYVVEVHPAHGSGWYSQDYAHNLSAGTLVHTTVGLYNHQRGDYTIIVRYRTVSPRPAPIGIPTGRAILVGRTKVHVP